MKKIIALLLLWLMSQSMNVANEKNRFATADIDTLVVCPLGFQPEMAVWIRHRERQGHGIVMVTPAETSRKQVARIRELSAKFPIRNLLLVGDCYANGASQGSTAPIVPRGLVRAKVNVRFGSEPMICTDNVYADLDDDRIPDLAVGRLSADTALELRAIIKKILDYENSPPPGAWKRKINLVAGVGGFGSLTDRIIESAARQIILKEIPSDFQTAMTYASWRSPYCPDPRNFHQATVDTLNEGCLFWVYFGHGHIHQLDQVKTPVSRFKIFNIYDKHKLKAHNGPPIAVLLACYTGAIDAIDDCLAEEMLEAPGGPVAVFAGSRITMPYAMAVLSHEMLGVLFKEKCQTLGELVLRSKQRLAAKGDRKVDRTRATIDGLAGLFSPARDMLDQERLEHVQLFNLLGDPLLRLPKSESLPLNIPTRIVSGQEMEIVGSSPHSGNLVVELAHERGKLPFSPRNRKEFKWTYEFLEQLQVEYDSANRGMIKKASFDVQKGRFRVAFKIPAELQGKYQVRAYLENRSAFAIGSSEIRIR